MNPHYTCLHGSCAAAFLCLGLVLFGQPGSASAQDTWLRDTSVKAQGSGSGRALSADEARDKAEVDACEKICKDSDPPAANCEFKEAIYAESVMDDKDKSDDWKLKTAQGRTTASRTGEFDCECRWECTVTAALDAALFD
ncbi:MAG: hypothetical protein KDD66_10820 [Bdellovibrionales bacterium]|nr:hypothetical protein [Bdellovibrionales bacterium]